MKTSHYLSDGLKVIYYMICYAILHYNNANVNQETSINIRKQRAIPSSELTPIQSIL
jgi:hypothetical protein